MEPSIKIVQAIMIRSSKNMAPSVWGLFSLYIYMYIENFFVKSHWTDFNITWQKYFLGDPLPRFSHVLVICQTTWLLISSPEQEVLMVSYCGQSMSAVRRPSRGVNNCFKSLLLLHPWAN